MFSCCKYCSTSLMFFFTELTLSFSIHDLEISTNSCRKFVQQLSKSISYLLTLIVAWLSISCQALSNFHSCFWLRKRCSARAIVSLAALWIPADWQITMRTWISLLLLNPGIGKRSTYQMPSEIEQQLPDTFPVHSCILHRHHNRVWIFLLSCQVSLQELWVVELIYSEGYGNQHSLPVFILRKTLYNTNKLDQQLYTHLHQVQFLVCWSHQ